MRNKIGKITSYLLVLLFGVLLLFGQLNAPISVSAEESDNAVTEPVVPTEPNDTSDTKNTDPTVWTMEYGDSREVESGATVKDISIVTVDNGVLRAVKTGETTVTVGGEEYKLQVLPAKVDVVLFTGQSNMVGWDKNIYDIEIPNGRAYEYKHVGEQLTEVKNPVGEKDGSLEASYGSSIVPQFCADYTEKTGRKIVAVHAARCGMPMSQFQPEQALYKSIVAKYNDCIDYLDKNENFEVDKKFYIIFQGETDTNGDSSNGSSRETYKTKYMNFHNGLKEECGVEFGALIQTGRNTNIYKNNIVEIAQAKIDLAYAYEDIILLNNAPINYYIAHPEYLCNADISDYAGNVHYSIKGLRKIASDSCAALVNYLGYGEADLNGVDPVIYLDEPNTMKDITVPEQVVVTENVTKAVEFELTAAGDLFKDGEEYEPVNTALVWKSGNPDVATVDKNGNVTGISAGTTVIKVRSAKHLSLYREIAVTVSKGIPHKISLLNAKFSDNSAEKSLKAGDTVEPVCTQTIPVGKTLYGWVNVEDKTEVFAAKFMMPDHDVTVAPVFAPESYFESKTGSVVGKVRQKGNLYLGREKNCYTVQDNGITGMIKDENGNYELGSIYRFNGGTAEAPADKMAIDSYFLTQEGNGICSKLEGVSKTVTTTVQNFGSEKLTLRFALITDSTNANSQYGEKIVTIEAGQSVTFSFDVTYVHDSIMLNVMVKDHEVSEVYIGVYQYITEKNTNA